MGKSKANKGAAQAEAKPEEVAKAPASPEVKPAPKKAPASPKKSPAAEPKKAPASPKKEPLPEPAKSAKKKGKAAAGEPPAAEEVKVGSEQVEAFFNSCIAMMTSSACRDELKDPSIGRPGEALIEMQNTKWDDLGISRDAGRNAVEGITSADKEMRELRVKLVDTAKATYLQAIKDRKPNAQKSKGDLPRDTLLEFFDITSIRLDQPDVVARLKEYSAKTGDSATPVLRELQNEVFELLGVASDHGEERLTGQLEKFVKDSEYLFAIQRWQRRQDQACVEQLRAVMEEGVTLKCDEAVKLKLFEVVAHDGLNKMEDDDKKALLDKNGKKVQVLRSLPPETRQVHIQKLSDGDKIELIKAELLLVNVMQMQQVQIQIHSMARSNGPWKAGVEFRTLELVKTADKKQAAIAKGSLGRVLEVDGDGDLRVSIASKDRTFYFIGRPDFGKLRICGESPLRRFEGSMTHPQFGRQAIPVFITLTSPKTGVWAVVGQSADIHIDLSGDRFVINQEETVLEGQRDAHDGSYQGRVVQEGDPSGHFYIREIPYVGPPPPKAEEKPAEEKPVQAEAKPEEVAKPPASPEAKPAPKKAPASPKKEPLPEPAKPASPKKEAKKKAKSAAA